MCKSDSGWDCNYVIVSAVQIKLLILIILLDLLLIGWGHQLCQVSGVTIYLLERAIFGIYESSSGSRDDV